VLRTNNDGEFTTAKLAAYCADEGVTRHFSVSYTPLQNGVVERRNQTVVAMAHALLKHRGMPAEFWGEVVVTVVYLQNRLPTKSFAGRTPYEARHGRKPAVSHLRVFGCQAFVKHSGTLISLPTATAPESSSATQRVQRRIASSTRWHGRSAQHVTSCSTRHTAGIGRQPQSCHQRWSSPSSISTSAIREQRQGRHIRAFQAHRHDHLLLVPGRQPRHPSHRSL
jgi:hypothetical protein